MKNLEEWLEEEHPETLLEYDEYYARELEEEDKLWEEYLEEYGRTDVCPTCGMPRHWVHPQNNYNNLTLTIPCFNCDDILIITITDGVTEKQWISEKIKKSEES